MRARRGVVSMVLRGGLHRMPFVAVVAAAVVIAGAGEAVADPSGGRVVKPPKVAATRSVKGVHPLAVKHHTTSDAAAIPFKPSGTRWPAAHTVAVNPSRPTGSAALGAAVTATGTPITVRAAGKTGTGTVAVRTVAHTVAAAAGLHGTVFTLTSTTDRTVAVTASYTGYADAEGGNFGSRLHLVHLPGCALTTPTVGACQQETAAPSTNDTRAQSVAGTVQLSAGIPQVLALSTADTTSAATAARTLAAAAASTDDGGGQGGSYTATTLAASGSWAQGGSSGSFTYSYPILVPPARTQLAPALSLDYDSSSIDGETSTSQAQANWAGDGWSTPQSYVEQTYATCADSPEGSAAPSATQDQCYDGPIVTMSLNGSSATLVRDDKTGVWKQETDSGTVITQATDSSIGNGTYDNDFWKAVTRDGSTYYFGLNHLPGWASGKTATNSVQTVPVFSAHDGDPCYHRSAATWAGSVCTMGYRWNLDYATDVRGNAMTYYYHKDTNYYGQNSGASMVSYDRDAYPTEADYGFVDGQAYGNVPNKVLFSPGPRCFASATTCAALTSSTASSFPDVPFSLVCAKGATCSAHSPSFFSTARLKGITAEQWNGTAATPGYQPIDSYALTESIPSARTGDAAAPTLWLSGITRTASDVRGGGSTTAINMPTVGFTATALQNRVGSTTITLPPMYRNRIGTVTTESGETIGVDYELTNPCSTGTKPTAASNTSSCFPVRWTPAGSSTVDDWFNRYAVRRVTEYDNTGGSLNLVTSYDYGTPAWHYDDNEVVKKKYRSYGQFHGYSTVTTYVGDGVSDARTKHVVHYYQGMSKDNSSTAVNVTDSQGGVHEDLGPLQGKTLEDAVYRGEGGDVESSTISSYWVSDASATRDRTTASLPALQAQIVAPAMTWTRQRVTSGSSPTWRVSATETSYDTSPSSDTFGLAKAAYSHTVPVDAAYDNCTVTGYAPYSKATNLAALESTSETDSVACSGYTKADPSSVPASGNSLGAPTTVSRPAQVKAASRTYYDGATSLSATPTNGQPTTIEEASDYANGSFVWALKGKTGYDTYGRITSSTDGNDNTTTTAYTDDAYGLVTAVKVTNPLSQSETQTFDPARGLVLATVDANQVSASTEYDPAGRLTEAWKDSRPTSGAPNYMFIYNLSQTGPTSVVSKTMNSTGGSITSTTFYDSLLRGRQTQTPSPAGGRVVADTFYDSRGWVSQRNNRWYDSSTDPEAATIDTATKLKLAVPSADAYTYDGLGRVIADESLNNGVVISTVHTIYNGDRTTVFPAQPGDKTQTFPAANLDAPIQTTIVDPLGRTSQLQQYTTSPTVTAPANPFTGTYGITGGTVTKTSYHFDGHGLQDSVTDDAGDTWTTGYNLLGQAVTKTDPVVGKTTSSYDGVGNLTETVDSTGHAVSYGYDSINRKTDQWAASIATRTDADKTGHWDYDDPALTYSVGKLTKTTTYVGGTSGAAYTTASTGFNIFGSSIGETVTIPSTEGALAGTYNYAHTYGSTTGLPLRDTYPAVAGLPAETLTHGYLAPLDLPNSLTNLEAGTAYDAYGRVQQATLGAGSSEAFVTNIYDDHTDLVTTRQVSGRNTPTPGNIESHTYHYDVSGNLTSDTQTRNSTTDTSETRCYQYDDVQRLTASWTANDTCTATPTDTSHSTVGDTLDPASAYWTTWTYDTIGRRTNQVQHSTDAATPQVSTAYRYASSGQPVLASATATSTTADGTSSTTTAVNYGYDGNGNLHTRTGTQYGDQTLTWDTTGKLTKVASTSKGDSTYTYDADGQLLSQHDPGTWTLYLPDGQLTLNTATNGVTGVRYYSLPGGDTAHRTGTGTAYGYDIADTHGTVELTLDNTAQLPTWRAFTPYGDSRGNATSWYDNRTFLNKPADDNTGFVDVGARFYDASTGMFISLDPVLNTADPQSLSGYAYASDNPITYSDPTGLINPISNRGDSGSSSSCYDTCQAEAAQGASHSGSGGGGGSASGNTSTAGSTCSSAQPVKKHWWQRGLDWVADNKNMLIGAAAGIATFAGCEALTGGAGSIGCLAAAGAVGKVTTDALNGDIHNANDVVGSLVTGAVEGVFSPELAAVDLVHQGGAVVDDVKHGDYAGAAGHALLGGLDAAAAYDGVKARGGTGGGCANSFTPITAVLLANGTTKPISGVHLGDKVLAADPQTGKTQAEPVTALHDNVDHEFVTIKIKTSDNHAGTLHTTKHHPFWDQTTQKWTDAGDLKLHDQLHTTTTATVTIVALHPSNGATHMLNLTINDLHTYYVLAGSVPVLVHNCPSGGGGFLSRLFGGGKSGSSAAHEPNATVRDLRGIGHDNVDENGNWISDPAKESAARSMTDEQLVNSTTQPVGGEMSLLRYHDEDNYFIEGNHRAAELIRRADSDNYPGITDDKPIYIHLWPGNG
jgi:RHS repeat-associated protein